jgi:hypothetical protein
MIIQLCLATLLIFDFGVQRELSILILQVFDSFSLYSTLDDNSLSLYKNCQQFAFNLFL